MTICEVRSRGNLKKRTSEARRAGKRPGRRHQRRLEFSMKKVFLSQAPVTFHPSGAVARTSARWMLGAPCG
jgi:hypothetical protein